MNLWFNINDILRVKLCWSDFDEEVGLDVVWRHRIVLNMATFSDLIKEVGVVSQFAFTI